jgi:glycosyltransferase involved in cell wall biosynthesis
MIGIFNDNFPPILDGVAVAAQNYAYWLHQKGHGSCVITPYAPGAEEVIDAAPYPIYRYPSVPIPMRNPYRLEVPQIALNFKRNLKDVQFDLVHAHCPFTSGILARRIAHRQNIPLVATFHSKYRQDFERAVPSKKLVDAEIKRIIKFYEQAYEVWIPQAAVEPTLREYGYKGHVEVVENGNDFATPRGEIASMRAFMRSQLKLDPKETMCLFVGQHIWEKGIDFMLQSLALIKHLPFKLYMIGTGYAVKDIHSLVAQLGLTDRVQMVGMVEDRQLLKRYFAAADLFLFPSLYDNAPLVVREAAAMHTPSLLLAESTAAEVIKDGHNGFLSIRDTQNYATTLQHLIEHPETIAKVGDTASKSIARSWEDVMDEVILRYADIRKRFSGQFITK